MNTKVNLLLFIIIGLFVTALISRNGSIALMIIPFLVFLGTGVLLSPGEIHLHARRVLSSTRNYEEVPVKMSLTIENQGTTISRLQVSETLQPKMHLVEGILEQRFASPSNERIELHYSFQSSRGRYSWQTVKITAGDPFGLFTKTLELKAEAHTLFLPKQFKLHHFKFRPRPTVRTTGPNLARQPGSGSDFWGVREYHPGDPLRSIYWRKVARHPRSFFSKEYEREEIADIGLLLDARVAANQVHGSENLFEYSIQAASSLAKYFLSAGNRVSMLVLNDRLIRVFPGYGKHQLVRILDTLAECTLGDRVALETLKYLPVKLFPGRSVIVLISPLLPDDFTTIRRFRAEGYQLLLVCPNPIEKVSSDSSMNTNHSFAVRAAGLERKILLRRIQKIGVPTIDWNTDQSLIETIQSTRFVKM